MMRQFFRQGFPRYFWASVVFAVGVVVVGVVLAFAGHLDWATFLLTIAVLAIALATLLATLPTPAQLWIERQSELGIDDVIFYLYDETGNGKVPRNILFQVHVAVANVGGRKAVLSALRIEALLDRDGAEIRIPEFALPILAQRVQEGSGWRITDNVMHKHIFLEFIRGPYVLEPDDVITMRLRAVAGIDWSARWTLNNIRDLAIALQRPVDAIRVTAVYRRGQDVVSQPFVVKGLSVLQQELYASRLRELTDNFRVLPTVAERAVTD